MNAQNIQQWALKDWRRLILLATEGSPWSTYQLIQKVWPGQMVYMEKNYVIAKSNRNELQRFLERKAREHSDPAAFLTALLKAVPVENPDAITALLNTSN